MATVSTTLPSDGQTIDASDVNTPINAILSEFNGNIDNDNIKTGANINGAKLLASSLPGSSFDTTLAGGWISGGLPAYSSATNNGNKSYDIVFASTVASLLSPGMRLRTTRTVTAPTQCADLEASSSQYFSSASPAGLSFTTTFTCSAWVKLESYALGGIIARRNADTEGWDFGVTADGRLTLTALRIAANNKFIASYQSLPLNKWVHVAATMDVSAGDTTAQKIWIDGVEVPRAYTLTGTCAALVQGTTALVVGAQKSAGTNPFDGKIAQAAVFSSQLSDATIKAMQAQTLSGSETNLVSAFSCNNSLLDLNTTNNNDLTASGGALMTNADSPFGQDSNGVTAGTTDYELVMKVNGATATVQVPEGCTIPTSGGVSAVAYSTATSPFGFTLDKGRWKVSSLHKVLASQASPVSGTFYNVNSAQLTIPVGSFYVSYADCVNANRNTTAAQSARVTLSTGSSTETDKDFSASWSVNSSDIEFQTSIPPKTITNSSATTYYLNRAHIGAATLTVIYLAGDRARCEIEAIPAGV